MVEEIKRIHAEREHQMKMHAYMMNYYAMANMHTRGPISPRGATPPPNDYHNKDHMK